MARGIEVDDVLAPKPGPGVLLRRGIAKRCPRCGGGKLYRRWFHMAERCPTCGYRFEREPGFFVGAYLINFAIAEGFLFVLIMGYIAWKASHPAAGVTLPIIVGLVVAIGAPILFYPYSRTIWSALDLLMTPLEVDEIVEAADAVATPDSPDARDRSDDGRSDPGTAEPG